jgi:predicted RNA methylase
MGLYNKKGLYTGYDKNNKQRDALDYYSTPTEEVENILNTMKLPLNNTNVLEPCCGGGHMVEGIQNYGKSNFLNINIIATDVQKRSENLSFKTGLEYDFLKEEYPYSKDIDYVIMNPPYATIEPFTIKALEIAGKGVLLLGRLQFLEGEKRFNKIFKDYPPNKVYVYVDRIVCYKNGDVNKKMASAQAYAWFYFDIEALSKGIKDTRVYWIRRTDKKKDDF